MDESCYKNKETEPKAPEQPVAPRRSEGACRPLATIVPHCSGSDDDHQ